MTGILRVCIYSALRGLPYNVMRYNFFMRYNVMHGDTHPLGYELTKECRKRLVVHQFHIH